MAGSENSDDIRRAVQTAIQHRDHGERPEAAGWFRRAAKLLLEDGDEDRALEFARMAADLEDDEKNSLPASSHPSAQEAKSISPLRGKASVGLPAKGSTGRHKAHHALVSEGAKSETGSKPSGKTGSATGRHKAARQAFAAAGFAGPPRPVAPAKAPVASAPAPKVPMPAPATSPPRTSALAPPPPSDSAIAIPLTRAQVPRPSSLPPRPSSLPSARPSAPSPSPAAFASSPRPGALPSSPRANPNSSLPIPQAPRPPSITPRPPAQPISAHPPARSNPPPPPSSSALEANLAMSSEALRAAPVPARAWTVPPPAPQAQRIDYIRARLPSLPCFDELTSERLREVSRQIQVLECDDGEFVFDAGAPPGPLFVLTSGSAAVETGDKSPLKVVVPEESVVGAVSALFAEPRLARVRARGPLEAFAIAPSLTRALCRESATLRSFLEKATRERIASLLPHIAPILSRLEHSTSTRLLDLCEILSVSDGTLLQLEGVASRSLYIIGAGEAELFGEPIVTRIVKRLGVGDMIGADSLRNDSPARVTVRAARNMLVARLPRAAYRQFANEFPDAARSLHDGEIE